MHLRARHIEKILLKRAKIFPVLGVLGPRQVGKSTFLMDQFAPKRKAAYLTFDKHEILLRAHRAPGQFLMDESYDQTVPLVIDEAQKVPHIFDSIKALVDAERRMGLFTLSGSVEFSSKSGVRESLAGRMGITRLYPMTLREINTQAFQDPWVQWNFEKLSALAPKSIETWLDRGGMPIFCGLSDIDERMTLVNSWLEAICYRDLMQLKDGPYDSLLALQLLEMIASEAHFSTAAHAASRLRVTAKAIQKHLSALLSLFLLYELPSCENPRATPRYRIFDAGVLNTLLGGRETRESRHSSLVTLVINEIFAQYEYAGKLKPNLYYYQTRGGAAIDLVLKTRGALVGIECVTSVDISPYVQRGMKSFLEKYPEARGYFIAPVQEGFQIEKNIHVIPWRCMG